MEGECVCVERWRDECACREGGERGGWREECVCVERWRDECACREECGGGRWREECVCVERWREEDYKERVSGEDVRLWEWEEGGVCRHNVCVN